MTRVLPVSFENCADMGRANASVPPPAGNGTIIVTDFAGHGDCARAGRAQATAMAPATFNA